ncbi:MAG: pyrroline-5-carboxylate reductase [Lachnospiraceae bacterium]|jgi:pyrroline-5-carboxylate reductase|nr:pyrroline-5-carboxylate reductase [Lachnospiraceae bacterium]
MKIAFIGMGNMGKAMINALLNNEFAAEDIIGADASANVREEINSTLRINVYADNSEAVKAADIIVLAIKPYLAATVLAEVKESIPAKAIILSIMAGKSIEWITAHLFADTKVVRAMPNIPALIGAGITAVCRNELVSDQEMAATVEMLQSIGAVEEIPETLMDAAVGVAGSAPAYVFLFIEALTAAAVTAGMPPEQALRFATHTTLGSACMILETGKEPRELCEMVCTPGGTTVEAVRVFEEKHFREIIIAAATAAMKKAGEM